MGRVKGVRSVSRRWGQRRSEIPTVASVTFIRQHYIMVLMVLIIIIFFLGYARKEQRNNSLL